MPRLEPTAQSRGIGLDLDDSALVLPTNRTFSMYLIGGPDLKPGVKDPTVADLIEQNPGKAGPHLSKDEAGTAVRQISIKGLKLGDTVLNFTGPNGKAALAPLEISVVPNADARQAEGVGKMSAAFRQELQSMTFREALIRVATDQMYSAIGRASGADKRYDDGGEWCGSFVRWCYEVVSFAKGVDDPFDSKYSLRSGIKTLWAGLAEPTKFTVMRYEGGDRFGGLKTVQKFIDIDDAHPVRMGDICLPRGASGDTFPHVCMVYDSEVTGGAFSTIDGNQTGAYNPGSGYSPYCIGINVHNADEKIKVEGKMVPAYAFIHVSDDLMGR